MASPTWALPWAAAALLVSGLVLVTAGVRLTKVVDTLADRLGIGEALAGAVLLGAATSLPGLVTTVVGAASGDAGFAVSNAIGGIAAQTTFLAIADMSYRRTNLEHAAASVPNMVQALVLTSLIGVVLAATGSPEVTVLGVHPATVLLVGLYVYGLTLARRARQAPMWQPAQTEDTVVDEPEEDGPDASTRRLGIEFGLLALVVGATGWVVGTAGLSLAAVTGLSGSLVGALFTSVITSLPELITVVTAVRIGALTLAVSDIIGGNTFDVLFVAAADIALREGSVYHLADTRAAFLMALTVVMTSVLSAGMLEREERHIGFEGVGILALYAVGVASLIVLG